nr:LPXTG cell wall anchor domain-containing protein [Streptococcus sp. 116-D4]
MSELPSESISESVSEFLSESVSESDSRRLLPNTGENSSSLGLVGLSGLLIGGLLGRKKRKTGDNE